MPYLRKRGTDDLFVSTPHLAARDDMLPVTDEQAQEIIKGQLSLKGTDFSQTTSEDGKRIVTKFLRKHGTNELFVYTDALALRADMVPTTEDQAAKIKEGLVDFQKLENVQLNPMQETPIPVEGRVDMTEPPTPPPVPEMTTPPAPQGAGTETTPPATPEVRAQGSGPTGPAGAGAGGPGAGLSDAKQEQIAKLGVMSKDEMVLFAKDKFQVDLDKRKSEDKVREIVTGLIQDNP